MSMAAGAAVLRSLATKLGRAPPRLPTRSGRSRFSTSTGGSMPNLREPSQNSADSGQLHSAKKSAPMPAATKLLCLTVFGATAFFYIWVKPRVEVFSAELIALRRERSILIKAVEECQRTHVKARDDSIDPSQAQITQAIGHGKESGGQAY